MWDVTTDTPTRTKETVTMAGLDTIWREAEHAMACMQEDGRLDPGDVRIILHALNVIEDKIAEIRKVIRPSGTYAIVNPKPSDNED